MYVHCSSAKCIFLRIKRERTKARGGRVKGGKSIWCKLPFFEKEKIEKRKKFKILKFGKIKILVLFSFNGLFLFLWYFVPPMVFELKFGALNGVFRGLCILCVCLLLFNSVSFCVICGVLPIYVCVRVCVPICACTYIHTCTYTCVCSCSSSKENKALI